MKNIKTEIVTLILPTFISLSAYPQLIIKTQNYPGDSNAGISPSGLDDTSKSYYLRRHYWDNVNFLVPQTTNTSLLTEKLDYYFNRLIPQQPDTVISYMKELLHREMAEPVKHSVLDFLIQYTSESKVMEMEKAFIWLAGNYYLFGCDWLPEKRLETIKKQYEYNQSCLVGSKAFNLWMETDEGTSFQLYQLQSNYTLLLFYDITSDASKDLVKELVSNASKLSRSGVTIVAVNTGTDPDKWRKFIRQENITEWHNVMDRPNRTNFRVLYGVLETPILFLLDRDKNIIGKRLTMEKVFEIINKKTAGE